uniref:ALOG domain-containing protein n=1 Tax=Zea mays TaxID=4577 RepID=A0A804P8V0_MAIZE
MILPPPTPSSPSPHTAGCRALSSAISLNVLPPENTICSVVPNLRLRSGRRSHRVRLLWCTQFGCAYYGQRAQPGPCPCPLHQAWGSLDALIGRLHGVRGERQDDRVQPLRDTRHVDLPPRSARLAGQGVRHPLRKEEEVQAHAADYGAFDELVCYCRRERQGYNNNCCGVRCSGWRE